MCGIAGIVRADGATPPDHVLGNALAAIEHRGPDEGGHHVAPGVALGIRRLRIIDLATGAQPISNEDGSVWVVQNGEIYNFSALRAELEAKGHRFRTGTDTETIVHAYEEDGEECVQRLRGMFAFALWDARRRKLLLARDRLGKKPIVFAERGGDLCFASEFQALDRLADLGREIDLGALGEYLSYGYVPAPSSIFRRARKLPPAHRLVWEAGTARLERYWSPTYLPKLELNIDDAVDELERILTEAVRLRLVADVPVGALLSGGVDSSMVVALMAKLTPGRVKTYTIGFEEASFDEAPHARRVAERFGTDHHELIVRADAASLLPTLVRHYGEPYADWSMIPTFLVSKLARAHVTVALNGDGGDEAFAGYDRYRAMWLADLVASIPGAWMLGAAEAIAERIPLVSARTRSRAARFLRAAAMPPAERYDRWMSILSPELISELVREDMLKRIERERLFVVRSAFAAAGRLHPIDRPLYTDTLTYLPHDLLVKMDIASMANSLETRSPLLDQEVVAFAARLPTAYKLRCGEQKYLLKRLARRSIPAENVDRAKMGFSVPVGSWLRGPLRELARDALLGEKARSRGYFRTTTVERMWSEHLRSQRDHAHRLWTLVMLELWQREFVDRDAVAVTHSVPHTVVA